MAKKASEFSPYKKFKEGQHSIDEFEELTELAYGLTQQLLFRHPKDEIADIVLPATHHKELSFCMGDQEIESVDLACEWISLDEYARRVTMSLEEVVKDASDGILGPVQQHPKTSDLIVVWPPEAQQQPLEKLPEPGKKTFTVKLAIKGRAPLDMDIEDHYQFDQVQKTFLRLAHSIGKPDEVGPRAEEALYRSCLLLRWTNFEIFLRSTIHELFRAHPQKLAGDARAKRPSLSYLDITAMSEQFTSIEALRNSLVERQIEQSRAEGQSIHGLINFLKSSFAFEEDPYEAWYVVRGHRHEADYNTLLEIKEVRNAIVHEGSRAAADFFVRFSSVPHRDGEIIIDNNYSMKAALVFGSVAYKIADSILQRKYHGE